MSAVVVVVVVVVVVDDNAWTEMIAWAVVHPVIDAAGAVVVVAVVDIVVVAVVVDKITVNSDECSVVGLNNVMRCIMFGRRLRWWENGWSIVCYVILTRHITHATFTMTYVRQRMQIATLNFNMQVVFDTLFARKWLNLLTSNIISIIAILCFQLILSIPPLITNYHRSS